MNLPSSKQNGVALIVALVALIVLTVLGVATVSDVMNQSTVVRNEQFRQSVFYAASSELNVQRDSINKNEQSEDDVIINNLLGSNAGGGGMSLDIDHGLPQPFLSGSDKDIQLSDATITATRVASGLGCDGESIGKSKVIAGEVRVTAASIDGLDNIKSLQTQRYTYCWP